MIKKLNALFLILSLVFVLAACGSDDSAESSASPTKSPLVEASATPVPSASPQATAEASAAPVITAAPETSIPSATATATATATPLATTSATPVATATAKPTAAVTPSPSPKPTATPKPVDANNGEAAAALFKQSCTSCHGVDLAGDYGPNLQKIGAKLTKAQITNQITNGGEEMPPFKTKLKAEEIETLAAWLAAKK